MAAARATAFHRAAAAALHGASIAAAEARTARRLARTWLFATLALGGGLAAYAGIAAVHALGSGRTPSLGGFQPRFLLGAIGEVVLTVFLAFDVRARDARNRVAEVLDARPVGNLALLGGRLAGLVLVVWVPMVLLVCLYHGFGLVSQWLRLPFGEPLEPLSTLAFLTVDALPMLALWCSLLFLLAVTLRNRLAVALAAFATLGLYSWGTTTLPGHLLPAFTGATAYTVLPSDVAPEFAPPRDIAQRAGELLLAAGMLLAAAALHPRTDDRRPNRLLAAGGLLFTAGCLAVGAVAWLGVRDVALRDAWRTAHEAAEAEALADVDRVAGTVVIEPGDALAFDLTYQLRARDRPLTQLSMAFNPGMRVQRLELNGNAVAHRHRNGLLVVEPAIPLEPGADAVLTVAASGVPDTDFGYLDSAIDVPRLTASAGSLRLLGSDVGVFDDAYVALMPGLHWLPTPGPATARDDPARYARDFFEVDLAVELPPRWTVAGPGRRKDGDGRFRFRPRAPVPAVALLAAPFERRGAVVAGVEVELLTSPKHQRNVAFFADAGHAIRDQLRRVLEEAAALGLEYPYRGLSLVEVPARLRTFGGGWRMTSVQALPGLLLVREYGFPSSRFEMLFSGPVRIRWPRGDAPEAKAEALLRYFDNDLMGGSLRAGLARAMLSFQTEATGEGALAIDFMLGELAQRVATSGGSGYFSAHALANEADTTLPDAFADVVLGRGGALAASTMQQRTGRPAVWDRVLRAPLADLRPADDPGVALDALRLKASAVAQTLFDVLGRETAGRLLAALRQHYAGRTFTADEFAALAEDLGVDVRAIVGDWLRGTGLPGFRASAPSVALADDAAGQPRYQTLVHVHNGERTPGTVRLRAVVSGRDGRRASRWGAPAHVAGRESVEMGLVTARPPEQIWVHPVLSLNRRAFRLGESQVRGAVSADGVPFSASRPSSWSPHVPPGIVVDDLDAGFRVRRVDHGGLRLGTDAPDADQQGAGTDAGLPVCPRLGDPGPGWRRPELPDALGRYRRTSARAMAGDGLAEAVFSASVPHGGAWRLDYHLPRIPGVRLGGFDIATRAAGVDVRVAFDAAVAEPGWNEIGLYDLPAGRVDVGVSDETTGHSVFADAIRWQPAAKARPTADSTAPP